MNKDQIYCPYCKRWVEYTHVCTYHRSRIRVAALCALLLAALLAPTRTHAVPAAPPTATIGEPVHWPNEIYLPIIVRQP